MKTELKTKYTVSEGTNEVLNVIAEFNAVLDKMYAVVGKNYVDVDAYTVEFLDAKQPLEDYMMNVLSDRIKEELNTTGSNEI